MRLPRRSGSGQSSSGLSWRRSTCGWSGRRCSRGVPLRALWRGSAARGGGTGQALGHGPADGVHLDEGARALRLAWLGGSAPVNCCG